MKRALINPLTIFIAVCSVIFAVVLSRESVGQITKLLFAPFLIDPGAGTNQELDWCPAGFDWCTTTSIGTVYFTITLVTSLMIVACLAALCALRKKVARITVSILGILIASAHYTFVGLYYILSGIH